MDEQNDRIKASIEAIEPAPDAKARMLANIKRKAAEQNAEPLVQKQTGKKASSFNRVMKWVLPIAAGFAACFVIGALLLGAVIVPQLSGLFGSNRKGAYMVDEQTAPSENYYASEPLDDAPLSPKISFPSGATVFSEKSSNGETYEYLFSLDGHTYRLYAEPSESQKVTAGNIGRNKEEEMTVTWSDESYRYLLENSDGATQEEMMTVYESIR